MKLIPDLYASPLEREHAYPAADAQKRVSDALSASVPVEGMDDLRNALMSYRDEDALAVLKSGEWRLVKDDAFYFDWGSFDKAAQEQRTKQRVMEIGRNPLPEKQVEKLVIRIVDSVTGEPLTNLKVQFVVGEENKVRKIDSQGIAYLSPAPAPQLLSQLQLLMVE